MLVVGVAGLSAAAVVTETRSAACDEMQDTIRQPKSVRAHSPPVQQRPTLALCPWWLLQSARAVGQQQRLYRHLHQCSRHHLSVEAERGWAVGLWAQATRAGWCRARPMPADRLSLAAALLPSLACTAPLAVKASGVRSFPMQAGCARRRRLLRMNDVTTACACCTSSTSQPSAACLLPAATQPPGA